MLATGRCAPSRAAGRRTTRTPRSCSTARPPRRTRCSTQIDAHVRRLPRGADRGRRPRGAAVRQLGRHHLARRLPRVPACSYARRAIEAPPRLGRRHGRAPGAHHLLRQRVRAVPRRLRVRAAPTCSAWTGKVGIDEVRRRVGDGVALQGNPRSGRAVRDLPREIRARVADILARAGATGHIFNLGHGVLPATDPEHVRADDHGGARAVGAGPMRIAVVGGGFGGLTAARARRGRPRRPRPRGRLAGRRRDRHEPRRRLRARARGQLVPRRRPARRARAVRAARRPRRAGLAPRAPALDLHRRQAARPADEPRGLVRSDLLTWRGKLDLLREPLRAARIAGTGDESMHAFAARRFGAEAARAIVAPFVTGIYAADRARHQPRGRLPAPRRRSTPRAASCAAWSASSRAAPSTRAFAAVQGKPRRPSPRAACGRPSAACSSSWTRSPPASGPASASATPSRGSSPPRAARRHRRRDLDGAVLAVPAEDAAGIVATPELAARLGAFRRAPAAVVYLGYPHRGRAPRRRRLRLPRGPGRGVRVLGVVFESVVWPDRAPGGHVLLRCIFGGGRDPAAAELDDAELIAQATRDVARVLEARGARRARQRGAMAPRRGAVRGGAPRSGPGGRDGSAHAPHRARRRRLPRRGRERSVHRRRSRRRRGPRVVTPPLLLLAAAVAAVGAGGAAMTACSGKPRPDGGGSAGPAAALLAPPDRVAWPGRPGRPGRPAPLRSRWCCR